MEGALKQKLRNSGYASGKREKEASQSPLTPKVKSRRRNDDE
jgi:hypothetical protein